MKKFILFFIGVILLAACNNPSTKATKTDSATKYTAAMIDNAKDPVCGMPAIEIGDTVHYNNKVIGFCSMECKDEFMKDAKKNFASVEWKKTK